MNVLNANIIRVIKHVLILTVILYIIYKLYIPIINISFPFLASLIIAYLLSPLVDYLNKKQKSRILSILLVYLIILILLCLLFSYLIPIFYSNLIELINKTPVIIEQYRIIESEFTIRYQLSNLPESIKFGISQNIEGLSRLLNNSVSGMLSALGSIVSNVVYIFLIPFITFYFLKDKEYLKEKLALIIPRKYRDDAIVTWYQIDLVLKRFIRGEMFVAVIVGTLATIGLYFMGIRFPFILGFIAGITNIIPYVGPFLGAIPAVLVALVESPIMVLKVGLIFFLIHQLESGIISPKIVGSYVGLHPVTIIFVILLWEQLFGIIGMFFAVPVTSIIVVIFNRLIDSAVKSYS